MEQNGLKAFSSALEAMFFPPRCLVCNALLPLVGAETVFCRDCFSEFSPLDLPVCRICGEPLAGGRGGEVCEKCLRRRPPYTLCRSLFRYNDAMRNVILQFKFRKDLRFLRGIPQLCREADFSEFAAPAVVVPVPLHKKRLQQRGFNQSLLLCKALFYGREDVKFVPELLQRMKNTPPQRVLSRKERTKNLQKVFRVRGSERNCSKRLYLVDDVMTTGSTIDECCKVLLESCSYDIYVLTLARAERKK